MGETSALTGPDLREGIAAADLREGEKLVGHADGEAVLLVRRGERVFAVGAACTHYNGPLGEGLVHGDTVRCPWHHACFDLHTGEALAAPALNPIAVWNVEQRGERLVVTGKSAIRRRTTAPRAPASVVIVGGGAAGHAAAEMLRREGYAGPVTILSGDASPPVDRPNLSKDYLAGTAPEEWIPLRPPEFFAEKHLDLVLGVEVTAIDVAKKQVLSRDGRAWAWDALLLATGATPVRLPIPGFERAHTLRTLADSRAIIAAAGTAKQAVVLGASFIGLEVAASLRARGIEVAVVAPEARPLERVLGPALGDFVRQLHESHGVVFHLGQTATSIDASGVTLANGQVLPADLVVAGIGVRPNLALAEAAGLKVDRGVLVDRYLQSSVPGIYAVGDIARWPDPASGEAIRVEHWVVAERHGQVAARNILGQQVPCDFAPFFWSNHYDVSIHYVGHAEKFDRAVLDGDLAAKDCRVELHQGERVAAVVTIGRDLDSLRAEVTLEGAARR